MKPSMEQHPKGKLVLEDGSIFSGFSCGHDSSTAGEVVFNTCMAGYPESLTDPSYAGQILTFTYPLIGNYGVPDPSTDRYNLQKHFESDKIHVKGAIFSECCFEHNHWNSDMSLPNWLKKNKIPALSGIDTRSLTIKLREKGVMLGKIIFNKDIDFYDPNKENLVKEVSRREQVELGNGKYKIIVVDCGIKNNIIRSLLNRNTKLKIAPYDYDFTNEDFDGLFISNGPGDPMRCQSTINNVKKVMQLKKPIFGICLGHQLLALAAGAKTYKLKFGHRSQNQPCVHNKKAYITSQNHGYAVKDLPGGWEELFYNANDGTNEGIRHKKLPFFSVQFHPEGACGPKDTSYLFDDFMEAVKNG